MNRGGSRPRCCSRAIQASPREGTAWPTPNPIDTNIYVAEGPGFDRSGVPGRFGEPVKLIASSREDHSPNQDTGRPGTPAELILRLLVLKHIRDWSSEELEREVCANLVAFAKMGDLVPSFARDLMAPSFVAFFRSEASCAWDISILSFWRRWLQSR